MINYSESFKTYDELSDDERKGINEWLLQVNHDNMGIETVKLYHAYAETESSLTAYSYIEIVSANMITKILGSKDFSNIKLETNIPLGRFSW